MLFFKSLGTLFTHDNNKSSEAANENILQHASDLLPFSSRISAESYAVQGVQKKPTIHEGFVARQMEKKGKISERLLRLKKLRKERSIIE